MHARMGRITFTADNADDVIAHVQSSIVPQYEASDGFKGFTLLIDRNSGLGIGISLWESEDAMYATDSLGDQARQGAAEAGSGEDQGRAYFDVPLDTRG